jgi:hypothetical protein
MVAIYGEVKMQDTGGGLIDGISDQTYEDLGIWS